MRVKFIVMVVVACQDRPVKMVNALVVEQVIQCAFHQWVVVPRSIRVVLILAAHPEQHVVRARRRTTNGESVVLLSVYAIPVEGVLGLNR